MLLGIIQVKRFLVQVGSSLSLVQLSISILGHPVPAPELVDEHPAEVGKRTGLLSAFPRTNMETWLRGAWPTNRNGVAQFTSKLLLAYDILLPYQHRYLAIFPGYYTGRAVHVHAKVFPTWTILPNGTFEPGKLLHTGQFFFEEEINVQVDKVTFQFYSLTVDFLFN